MLPPVRLLILPRAILSLLVPKTATLAQQSCPIGVEGRDGGNVQVSTGRLRNLSTLFPNQFSPSNRIIAGIESIAVVSDSAPVLSCL